MFGLKLSDFTKELSKNTKMDEFVKIIPEASKKSELNHDSLNDKYNLVLSEAQSFLRELSVNFTRVNFEKATDKLSEAQKLKPNRAESYFYLSWLFLFADDIELAMKYMKVVSAINPIFENIEILKNKISDIQLVNSHLQKDRNPITSGNSDKTAITDNKPKPVNNFNAGRAYSVYKF